MEDSDKVSNYSFIFSKSKKDVLELEQALGDFNIDDKKSVGVPKELNASLVIGTTQRVNLVEDEWSGNQISAVEQQKYRWSYYEYMKIKEQEEERARVNKKRAKIEVITIDE